jgi:hypothetical protein
MTKPMDKKEVLFDAFHNQLAEILHYYSLTPEQRQTMADAKIKVNDWAGQTPALPYVVWTCDGHTEGMICPELMGRNRASIVQLGRAMAKRCYRWTTRELEDEDDEE